jgi:hypothetical protein
MRRYETITNSWLNKKGEIVTSKKLNRGLKKVHIGGDVWLFGRQNNVPGKGKHMVIYAPDRKTEHHVWGNTVTELTKCFDSDHWDFWGYANRSGNRAIEAKVKIYILTAILDSRDNWCFDLNKFPKKGPLKVVYENGTVKNIEFGGIFDPVKLTKRWGYEYSVRPVAYRK